MKLMTFTVPCYNSEDYMEKCIDSLLVGGDEVEIIIVNDGSTDNTGIIANKYAETHPSIVKVVHKQNGGHGSGINSGIANATGLYFKVVDSDDWVNEEALLKLLATIKEHLDSQTDIDLYLTNFIYDKVHEGKFFIRKFHKKFKDHEITRWKDVKRFHGAEVILMHSITLKTEIIQKHDLKLPEHTFYVDNIYAFQYLPFVKNIFYMNINLYHYFIGREDQSVNMKNFIKRYDQQLRVMKIMIDRYSYDEIMQMEKGLKRYMFFCLSSIMIITITFTSAINTKERKHKLNALWKYIKDRDVKLYKKLFYSSYPAIVNWIPFRFRGYVTTLGYKYLARKVKLG